MKPNADQSEFQRWLESVRVASIGPEQERLKAWLAAHPANRQLWEEEQALDDLLHRLPDVPVATNFTARVMAASAREESPARVTSTAEWWRRLWPLRPVQFTFATIILLGIFFGGWLRYESHLDTELVRSLRVVSTAASGTPVLEVLQDFEAIDVLGENIPLDEELWAALQ